jgi:hypothetical protein
MPAASIKSFASKSGKSEAEVERLWNKAKERAKEQGHTEDWPYIVGILKTMLGMNEETEVPVALLEQEGGGATTASATTTADYPIKPPAGGYTKPKRRVIPDSVIYGLATFNVDASDFMGMSKARMTGARYPIRNEKVKEYMRENGYSKAYILKYEDNILKIGKHMTVAK